MDAEEILHSLVADYMFSEYEYVVIENEVQLLDSFIKYLNNRRNEKFEQQVK